MSRIEVHKEKKIEHYLRKHPFLLYSVTFITAALLYLGIYYSMLLFKEGHYWALILSGLFAHSFFVITMHDGAHQAITGKKIDFYIMNICAGLIVLPLYTELFKKYHLLHHANTNTEDDPLWNEQKKRIFNKNKVLYGVLQCLPFVFNLYILIQPNKTKKDKKKVSIQPALLQIILSFIVATTIVIIFKPGIWFVLGTFTVMTTLGAFRYWGEHMGVDHNKQSNTHWFPLGMGIGNHEVHHHYPGYSWLTLTIGLLYRKKDTNPFKSAYRLLFNKDFHHYKN